MKKVKLFLAPIILLASIVGAGFEFYRFHQHDVREEVELKKEEKEWQASREYVNKLTTEYKTKLAIARSTYVPKEKKKKSSIGIISDFEFEFAVKFAAEHHMDVDDLYRIVHPWPGRGDMKTFVVTGNF